MRVLRRSSLALALALLLAATWGNAAALAAAPAQAGCATRIAYVTDLLQALGVQPAPNAAQTFSDVPPANPDYGYVEAAYQLHITAGISKGVFGPNAPINRAEAAAFEVRAYGASAVAAAGAIHATSFTDNAKIPSALVGFVGEAAHLGLLHGFPDGTFRPLACLSGPQAQDLVQQLLSALGFLAPWTVLGPSGIDLNGYGATGKLQTMAVDEANPSVMYLGGGMGPGNSGPISDAGVYGTSNGGTTWHQLDSGLTDHIVSALWLDQANPSVLVAGTGSAGIFRSTDAGASWTLVDPAGSTTDLLQVGSALYAATLDGVLVSKDQGATWQMLVPTSSPARVLAQGGGQLFIGPEPRRTALEDALSPGGDVQVPPGPRDLGEEGRHRVLGDVDPGPAGRATSEEP